MQLKQCIEEYLKHLILILEKKEDLIFSDLNF